MTPRLALLCLLLAGCSSEGTPYAACQRAVRDRLASPGSAVFPDPGPDVTVHTDDSGTIVMGYVDSQNGSGALMRSDFSCHLSRVDGQWQARDVVVAPKSPQGQ